MHIGYIGLGKMGRGMVLRLKEKGYHVIAYNRSPEPRGEIARQGVPTAETLVELVSKLRRPRLVWLMVSHGAVDAILAELLPLLSRGDAVVDGGNCFYEDTIGRARHLKKRGIRFIDVGVSGGPVGARKGACLMMGGDKRDVWSLNKLFRDLAAPHAFLHVGESGAGHFVKMVHNGIEYGMMQAIAEGFEVLKKSPYKLNLEKVANLCNHQSVIESRLVGWLERGFKKYGRELKKASAIVSHTGEAEWTVKVARKLKVPVPIIEGSLRVRKKSRKNPRFAGKVLSTLRNQFGGHAIS